jgi:hypothetical protein
VDVLYGTVSAQLSSQERERREIDLELPWRMVSFLEGVVLALADPSGELRVAVLAVQDRFEETKRLIKGFILSRFVHLFHY